ncbi:hypothetical protein ACQ4LE_011131 [Meloidogyne hapla]|uniref:BTB domain-containing protein n=1 Tax=Meloidogyne hapla TaxID=6305 RepID=A0A1I8BN83_MELHA
MMQALGGVEGILEHILFRCEVTISDTTPECFRALLEYFYTGKINKDILEKHLQDIFAIAHKYQVTTLKYECEHFMSDLLDDKNFLKYCGIVSLYGAPTLEDACKDYCCTNRSFLNSKEWEDVTIAYTELAFKFMKFVIDDLDKNKSV